MINKEDIFLRLKEYMEIHGISGHEEEVVKALKKNTENANVEFKRDGLGSLIITKKNHSKGPKILLAAHMDEVGFSVLDINDNGQILVVSVGGVWPLVFIGTKAKIITSTNKEFYGIFGHTSIHILEAEKRTKAPTIKDMYVDFGFKNKEEALEQGIQPGDRIYVYGETLRLFNPDLVAGKAMDNRAGITVLDFVVNALKDEQLPNVPYFVGTVQEEVGTRGAKVLANSIEVDVAIAIDTTASHDTINTIKGTQKLGMGVAIRMMDSSTIMNPKLVEYIYNLAKKKNIAIYKFVAQGGGTDAAELQYGKGGVPTLTISIPQRYLHSPIGVCDLNDIKAIIELLIEFFKIFDNNELKKIVYK
ncbi:M42 family metallopeptidase [Mesomycoplasma neurolyticum]|uniref:Aminopeptidase ysdC n=1 Tax=Mesomycoplasma neurolyticum TaxID=2120 RepID=A0A449A4Y3_9BACT|nr:M42 family metallopeptidase [Mesomycoplasma neurolyticum]VEU59305.1 Putative aminopeptidase ysdC [Mesomycoplasma neurolyticum]